MSKRKKKILILVAAVLLVALIVYLVLDLVLVSPVKISRLPELPGVGGPPEHNDPDLLAPGLLKVIRDKLEVQLAVDFEPFDGMLAVSYETAARRGDPGERMAIYTAADQIMYGRGLVRMGKRSDFFRWIEAFDGAFRSQNQDFHARVLRAEDPGLPYVASRGEAHWSVTLAYTRALLEGYRIFGGKKLALRISQESARLLPLFLEERTDSELTAGPRALLAYDEWDVPPPGALPEPGGDRPLEEARGTHLADIDLWALLALSRFDPAWAPVAADWQRRIASARLDADLPLYASAIGADRESYMAVTGGQRLSRTREQLQIALTLAEAGILDREFISFVRSGLRDQKRLPAGWDPITSASADSQALPSDYALALMLGRASEDQVLMDSAREVLMFSYASSQTSDLLGGWYRPGETARTFRLTAEDNTAILSALR